MSTVSDMFMVHASWRNRTEPARAVPAVNLSVAGSARPALSARPIRLRTLLVARTRYGTAHPQCPLT